MTRDRKSLRLDKRRAVARIRESKGDAVEEIVLHNGIRLGKDSPLLPPAKSVKRKRPLDPTDLLDPAGRMNRTERFRAGELEAMRIAGHIVAWYYESVTLVLADNTRYTPDFVIIERVVVPDVSPPPAPYVSIVIDEVKGFWRDDARVKIKVAARTYPLFRFRALKRRGNGWSIEEIKP